MLRGGGSPKKSTTTPTRHVGSKILKPALDSTVSSESPSKINFNSNLSNDLKKMPQKSPVKSNSAGSVQNAASSPTKSTKVQMKDNVKKNSKSPDLTRNSSEHENRISDCEKLASQAEVSSSSTSTLQDDTKAAVLLQLLLLRLQLHKTMSEEEANAETKLFKKWREVFEAEEEAFNLSTQVSVNSEIIDIHNKLMDKMSSLHLHS